MGKHEIIVKRVCSYFAMIYALQPDIVWEIYLETHSLDKTLERLREQNNDKLDS